MRMTKGDLTLVNALLWDGTDKDPEPRQLIEINKGRIVRIGGTDKVSAPRDTNVLDVQNRFVMPGLIDCHVHLVYSGFHTMTEVDSWPIEYHAIRAAQNAATLLSCGYTTIRDVGTRGNIGPSVRDAIHQGWIPGPRMVACGPMICSAAACRDPADLNKALTSIYTPVSGIEEIRRAVRSQIRLGVDCIKVFVTGSEANPYTTTDQTLLSPEELTVLVQEARRCNKMVACHAQSYLGAKIAIQAKVDTIEHGTRLDDHTIDELFRAKGTFLVPTLSTISSVLELSHNEKQLEEMRTNAPLWRDSFRRAHDAGIKIAAGSDVGNRYVHGQQAKELELLVENGFTEKEALIASTKTASQALGLANLIGTVEQGKLGDLLITNSNPLCDVRVLQRREEIYGVVKEGHFFPNKRT